MDRNLVGKRPTFRPAKAGFNIVRFLLLVVLVLAGLWILLGYQRGDVKPAFQPTPTPTRTADSYFQEAQAYFQAGKLDAPDPFPPNPPDPDAIDTYRRALEVDPANARAWAELARIQTYSINMLSSDAERRTRLIEALESIDDCRGAGSGRQHHQCDSRLRHLDWNASYASETEAQVFLNFMKIEIGLQFNFGGSITQEIAAAFFANPHEDFRLHQQAEDSMGFDIGQAVQQIFFEDIIDYNRDIGDLESKVAGQIHADRRFTGSREPDQDDIGFPYPCSSYTRRKWNP